MNKPAKKLILAVLSVLMMLSAFLCLSTMSFAVEENEAVSVKSTNVATERFTAGKIKSISLNPVKAYVLYEGLSSGYDNYDGSGVYYHYYLPEFNEGDKLTITYTDSTTAVYSFKVDPNLSDSGHTGWFVASNGKKINDYDLDCQSTQQEHHWTVGGKYNNFTISYGGASCKIPVTIKKNPIQSISAKYKYTVYKPDGISFNDWYEEILDDYVIYSIKLTNGSTYSGTDDQVAKKFGRTPGKSIRLTKLGINKGICNLGSTDGVFTVNVAKYPDNSPSCVFNTAALHFVKGQKVDMQLIKFSDKGYSHYINIFCLPDGLKLSQNGRLTGTVTMDYSEHYTYDGDYYNPAGDLSFDVRWKGTDVHAYSRYINIFVYRQSDKVKIPSNASTMPYNKAIGVKATSSNPIWYKFRSRDYSATISSIAASKEYTSIDYSIYDSKGFPVVAEGCGDGIIGVCDDYLLNRGEYYYIKIRSTGKIELYNKKWMPSWTAETNKNGVNDTVKLTKTNYKKTFSGDGTCLWNVYSMKGTVKKDFKNDFIWTEVGTMRRFASPVNLYMQTTAKSNADIIGYETFKYDPNNVKECEAIGASTKQDTLKKELLKGEKEYRFDTVYYLMPQIGKLTIEDSSLLYVPSCYKLDAKQVHVIKRSGHSSTAKVTKATTSKDGKAVYHCNACKADVKIVTLSKVTSFKLAAVQYTYDGKVKTPGVVVKDSKGKVLKNGTDYTVKYASGRKNPGKYAVVITLKGNYYGSKTMYFNIVPGVTSSISVSQTTSSIKLLWKAVPGASGYRVYRYDTKTKKYIPLTETTSTAYTLKNLKPSTTYRFAVRAFKTVGTQTLWSESFKAVTTATRPTAPVLTAVSGVGSVTLKWTKQSGSEGYVVYMSQTPNGSYTKIANIKGESNLSYTKKGFTSGKTYYFKIRSYKVESGAIIYSSDSTVKSVTVK